MEEKKYIRLGFDFAKGAVESLDDLVELTGAKTRAEVLQKALENYSARVYFKVKAKFYLKKCFHG